MAYEELLHPINSAFGFTGGQREINAPYRPLLAELGLLYPQYLDYAGFVGGTTLVSLLFANG